MDDAQFKELRDELKKLNEKVDRIVTPVAQLQRHRERQRERARRYRENTRQSK